MSQGIGKRWYEKYKGDTEKDYLIIDFDKKVKIPRYYDKQLEKEEPEKLEKIKKERERRAKEREADNTRVRRIAKNICKKSQNKRLIRGLEQC